MRNELITVSHRDRFGNFNEIKMPAIEAEIGWRAYYGLTRESMFPLTTIEQRYLGRYLESGASRT